MPKVVIFTPSNKPGFDVTFESIKRQKFDGEIIWLYCDQLFDKRWNVVSSFRSQCDFVIQHFYFNKKPDYMRNLAASYNIAIRSARNLNADLLISLQDYIYIEEDGVQKFWEMYQQLELELKFKALYTGLCSISSDPDDNEIYDINGSYTIFTEPYLDKPSNIRWRDCRLKEEFYYAETTPIEFECNWSCIPRTALYDEALYYDEEFDKAIAYENQDYAYLAQSLGYKIFLDHKNEAISLPHKDYFSEVHNKEGELTHINKSLIDSKWS